MWSFREGLGVLVEALREKCGAEIVAGVCVRTVAKAVSWSVTGEDGRTWPADAVVLTHHADEQAAALCGLDPALADDIAGIAYSPVAVVAVGYRKEDVPPQNLDGFGFIAPQAGRATFSAYSGVRRSSPAVRRTAGCCGGRCAAAGTGRT